jgi:AraC-like DNA-binding protein
MESIQIFKPHLALQSIVSNIFTINAILESKEENRVCHYPPTPQHCIFLYINNPLQAKKYYDKEFSIRPSCVVVGPQLTKMSLMINQTHRVAVIGFQPGGLYRFLGIPMHELFDDGFDGIEIMGKDVNELLDQCREKIDMREINELIQNFLMKRVYNLQKDLPFDKAIHHLVYKNGNMPIADFADLACVSIRQVERICQERLGMSPKLYARLIRFSNAYRMKEKNSSYNWMDIAYKSGYYDQMHFIRDFKEFAGVTPKLMESDLNRAPIKLQKEMIM